MLLGFRGCRLWSGDERELLSGEEMTSAPPEARAVRACGCRSFSKLASVEARRFRVDSLRPA